MYSRNGRSCTTWILFIIVVFIVCVVVFESGFIIHRKLFLNAEYEIYDPVSIVFQQRNVTCKPVEKVVEIEKIVEKIVEKEVTVAPKLIFDIPGLVSRSHEFKQNQNVPKIIHYTWYGNEGKDTLRFHHFMSIVSVLKFVKPIKIMFWHERPPQGDLWEKAKSMMDGNSTLIMQQRNGPTTIFGNPVKIAEHQSDIVRMEALINYGGIYMDLDVLILKSIDSLLGYDVTLGYETQDWLGNGFIMAKASAAFLKLWYLEYATFRDSNWNYHAVQIPGKLAKQYPNLVHTEWETINRPNWSTAEVKKIYDIGIKYDWSNNYAMHLWYRKYEKDHNIEDIKTLNSTLGEMFRWIYYGNKDLMK